MIRSPRLLSATIRTTYVFRLAGRRLIVTRVILRPRRVSVRLPFTNTLTATMRRRGGWWILKEKRRRSTQRLVDGRPSGLEPRPAEPPPEPPDPGFSPGTLPGAGFGTQL